MSAAAPSGAVAGDSRARVEALLKQREALDTEIESAVEQYNKETEPPK